MILDLNPEDNAYKESQYINSCLKSSKGIFRLGLETDKNAEVI